MAHENSQSNQKEAKLRRRRCVRSLDPRANPDHSWVHWGRVQKFWFFNSNTSPLACTKNEFVRLEHTCIGKIFESVINWGFELLRPRHSMRVVYWRAAVFRGSKSLLILRFLGFSCDLALKLWFWWTWHNFWLEFLFEKALCVLFLRGFDDVIRFLIFRFFHQKLNFCGILTQKNLPCPILSKKWTFYQKLIFFKIKKA